MKEGKLRGWFFFLKYFVLFCETLGFYLLINAVFKSILCFQKKEKLIF